VVLGEDLRAGGHLQCHVGALGPGLVAAHAVNAGLGAEMLLVAVVDQRVETIHCLNPDIAAAAAVAAVGTAEFDEFLAPKRHRAGAAVARADIDFRLIEKFHRIDSRVVYLMEAVYAPVCGASDIGITRRPQSLPVAGP